MAAQNQIPLTSNEVEQFIEHCKLAMSPTPDMEYYSSVALCALDAVFSIQSKYHSVVSPMIDRLCNAIQIPRKFENSHIIPDVKQQITISEFRKKLNCSSPDELAIILHNRQRTSSKNGILKADAFLQYLDVFEKFHIETYQDILKEKSKGSNLELRLRKIKGQNVAVNYFFMLTGNTNDVKVDTRINQFVNDAIGRQISSEQIVKLFNYAVDFFRSNGYSTMNARHLDHIVWSWQQSR